MRKFLSQIDLILLLPVLILVLIGIIMIVSTSSVVGGANYQNEFYFIKKHALYLVIGLIGMGVGSMVPYQVYRSKLLVWGFFGAFLLLCATFVPGIGIKMGGANRWLNLGVIRFQPVEVMKFFVVVFLASSLDLKQAKMVRFFQGVAPIFLVIMFPLLVLLKQPDLGNTGLILMVTMILVFLGGIRWRHLFIMISGAVSMVVVTIMTHPYQLGRIQSFLSPLSDPLGKDYHMSQSLIAIGSGGFFGLGLGESKLKFFYLPLQYSDFIFSIICEEGGFILAVLVIGLFGVLFYRGIMIGKKSKSTYAYLLAVGLTLLMVLQALLNIGVVIGVVPVTGIPLTFISFGGTSLMTSLFYVGVLINISKDYENWGHDN